MTKQEQLKQELVKNKIVTEAEFVQYEKESVREKMSVPEYLVNKKVVDENVLYEYIAGIYELPFVSLKDRHIRQDVLFLIPEPIATKHDAIAFDKDDEVLKIATTAPDDIEIFEFIQKKTGVKIEVYIAAPSGLKEILKQYHRDIKTDFEEIASKVEGGGDVGEDLQKLAKDLPVIRIVNSILEYAVFEGASDIHIEPTEKNVLIRYRIDGILREVMNLPKSIQSGVIARIKILANLKIDEHRLPQDGRFKVETKEYKISFRASTIPVYDGEKIVLRILNEDTSLLNLSVLGMRPHLVKKLREYIHKSHGIELVTGPTGSGKTTTLYSMVNEINKPEISIVTIEDPIEYHLAHISQSQINPRIGFTFALGLRALLRQDPDIMMVGEIRDLETVEVAVHSSMTGHLVISTLHTNSAVEAISRLIDMKVEPFLLAATLAMVMAQRLVRKLCDGCKESYQITDSAALKEIEHAFSVSGLINLLKDKKELEGGDEERLRSTEFFRGKGCKKCNESGYKGRVGIYELFEVTPLITDLIVKRASIEEIEKASVSQGMISMIQDGFLKAKEGITSIDEILRVTQE